MGLRKALDQDRAWIVSSYERGIALGDIASPATPPGRLVARAIHGLPVLLTDGRLSDGKPALLQLALWRSAQGEAGFALMSPVNQCDLEILALGVDDNPCPMVYSSLLGELLEGPLRRCTVIAARTPAAEGAMEGALAQALADHGFRMVVTAEDRAIAWELVLPYSARQSRAANAAAGNRETLCDPEPDALPLARPATLEADDVVTARAPPALFDQQGRVSGLPTSGLRLLSGMTAFTLARTLSHYVKRRIIAPARPPEAGRTPPVAAAEPLTPLTREQQELAGHLLDNVNLKA